MVFEWLVALAAAGLFAGMLLLSEIGRRIGVARFRSDPDSTTKEGGAAEAATMLLLPALDEMNDITTTRAVATQTHPPAAIFLLLAVLCVVGALLVGHGASQGKHRHWFYPVMFAAILSTTVFVIVDIEYPRLGLIRVDAADQILLDLRKSMQ